jgi:hypothetical protein
VWRSAFVLTADGVFELGLQQDELTTVIKPDGDDSLSCTPADSCGG